MWRSSRTAPSAPVHRFVHGRSNRSTTRPPTTSHKISQPTRSSKHFQTTEDTEKNIRRNIIDSMGSSAAWGFDSMTISTRDVRRSKHLSSKRRHSNSNDSRPEAPTEENDVNEETTSQRNMFSRKTSPQQTSSFRETIFQ